MEEVGHNNLNKNILQLQETLQYDVFHLERRILWCYGIYFGKDLPSQKLHFLRVMGTFLVLSIFDLGMLMKIIVDRDKLEIVFQTVYHVIMIIVGQIKILSLYRALSQFNDLENMLQGPIFNTETSTRCPFVSNAVKNFINFKKIVWRMAIFTAAVYSLIPLIDGNLPIPLWRPIKMFELYYQLYEIVCIWIVVLTVLSTDFILIGLLYLMSIQIKTLNFNLRNVTDRNPDYDAETQEKQVQDNLRICIRHHLAISDFVSKLEEIFSFGLFLQIFSSIIAICSEGVYVVAVTPTPSSFVILVASMSMILLEIAMYCWVGQGLITESERVGESCYMSEWYTCNTTTRKMFFVIMERSKRVISFKAGKFFELSFATFVMIIRNAYSYFTVIVTAFK